MILRYPHLNVRHANNDLFELIVLPSTRRSFDHGEGGIILSCFVRYADVKLATHTHKFVVFHVEENELRP